MEDKILVAVRLHQAGKLAEAEAIYRQILQRFPHQPDALHYLGLIAGQSGHADDAISLIRKATEARPDYAEAYANLGRILADRADLPSALSAYQAAEKLRRSDAMMPFAIGILLRRMGRLDEALLAFERAIRVNPNFAEAYTESGSLLRGKGEIDKAIQFLSRAIALNPNQADSHNALGNALVDKGSYEEAIAAYTIAIQIDRSKTVFHLNLGAALVRARRLDEALLAYQFATEREPTNIDALTGKATLLMDLGQPEAAIGLLTQVLEANPHHAEAHQAMGDVHFESRNNLAAERSFREVVRLAPASTNGWIGLGVALRSMGKFADASQAFRQVLSIDPQNAMAFKHLSAIGMVSAPEVLSLERRLVQDGLSDTDRVAAGFAIAKLLDDGEQYDEAFHRYVQANTIVKKLCASEHSSFDGQSLHIDVTRQTEIFTTDDFTKVRNWGNPSDAPVFVVGMPRSGTTLVEQIIASHPCAFGAGELNDIGELRKKFRIETSGNDGDYSKDRISVEADAQLQRLQARAPKGVQRIVDKMPGNIFNLGLIATLFPNARVIFCRRDARDTCLSCYFQWFANNGLPFSYDLLDCATQYLEQQRLEAHWLKHLPLRFLPVQYEEMVQDLEGQSRRLIDFLGLDWSPKCLDFHKTERSVNTSSVWQVRQPIYTRSVGRWTHYKSHLGPLLQALGK